MAVGCGIILRFRMSPLVVLNKWFWSDCLFVIVFVRGFGQRHKKTTIRISLNIYLSTRRKIIYLVDSSFVNRVIGDNKHKPTHTHIYIHNSIKISNCPKVCRATRSGSFVSLAINY